MISTFFQGISPTQFSFDIHKMYAIFKSLHPEKGFLKGDGVIMKYNVALKKNFAQYDEKILKAVAEKLTFHRLRAMNQAAQIKKRKNSEGGSYTLRGRNVDNRLAFL